MNSIRLCRQLENITRHQVYVITVLTIRQLYINTFLANFYLGLHVVVGSSIAINYSPAIFQGFIENRKMIAFSLS